MKVLVVDDEQAVRESLRRTLAFNGYEVHEAEDGERALEVIPELSPDVTILDVMMPKMDGLEVCRQLRSQGYDRPILMLTAKDGVSERVAGLDAGADDYLSKPFALEELLARVRSLMRRAAADQAASTSRTSTLLEFEDLTMDQQSRRVTRGERAINLTRTEFALLEVLMQSPEEVISREKILEAVWGNEFSSSGNALEVYIGYLRKKTEAGGEPRIIHTVRGVGYALRSSNR